MGRLESLVDVVGIGALNWDRLFLVDRFAAPGEEIVIREVKEEAGGSSANTISGLSRVGIRCGFIGKVGSDAEGEKILSALEKEGVELKGVVKSRGRSGRVFAFVDSNGERTMYVDPGVNDELKINEVDQNYLRKSKFIHISSFAGRTSFEAIKKIPEIKDKAKLSFSPGFLSYRGIDFLKPLLRDCTILFLNEKEAEGLTGKTYVGAGKILRGLGVESIVFTLGKKGCAVLNEDGWHRIKAYNVKAVDTTGAGDAFSAGFLYGVLSGFNVSLSARIGNFFASSCIQKIGARMGLPHRDALDSFLKELV